MVAEFSFEINILNVKNGQWNCQKPKRKMNMFKAGVMKYPCWPQITIFIYLDLTIYHVKYFIVWGHLDITYYVHNSPGHRSFLNFHFEDTGTEGGLCSFSFWSHLETCRILVPWPGSRDWPCPKALCQWMTGRPWEWTWVTKTRTWWAEPLWLADSQKL